MNARKLRNALDKLEDANESLARISSLFKYETLDEADPKFERNRRDVTFEIGGPSTHIQSFILTRLEHTTLKNALLVIFNDRKLAAEKALEAELKDVVTCTQQQ